MKSFESNGLASQVAWLAMASSCWLGVAHAKTIYVDNASTCTVSCGATLATAHADLRAGVATLAAGDTLKIVPRPAPYYYYPDGLPRANINQLADSVIDLTPLKAKTPPQTSPVTLITSNDSNTMPVIRGTLKFGGWSYDGQFSDSKGVLGYRYHLNWTQLRADDGNQKLQPQQVFRNGLNGSPDKQLVQVGGTVYGGYPQSVPSDMTPAATGVPGAGMLWPPTASPGNGQGRLTPSFDESNPSAAVVLDNDQFYYDQRSASTPVLYVQLSTALPASEKLEVSVLRHLVKGSELKKLTIQNIRFERSNTSAYSRSGALALAGTNILLDSLHVYDADSQCLDIAGDNNVVSYSGFFRCGQVGIRAIGSNVSITVNNISKANIRGFNPNWEAGGMKSIGGSGLQTSTISYNIVSTSYGDGIWLDTGNNGNTIEKNVVANGTGIGIHLELSSNEKVLDNIVMQNGAQGIQLLDSANNQITGNRIILNAKDAILIAADDTRAQPPLYSAVGNVIKSNFMGWNDNVVNRKAVWVTNNTTLDLNRYCGAGASLYPGTSQLSMHFWSSSLPSGNNVFRFSDWKTQGGSTRDLNSKMAITSAVPNALAVDTHLNLSHAIDQLETGNCAYP